MKRQGTPSEGPLIVSAFGGHWAICPKCLWDSGEALPRGRAQEARARHPSPCPGVTPQHYSTERIRENQAMLSGQS